MPNMAGSLVGLNSLICSRGSDVLSVVSNRISRPSSGVALRAAGKEMAKLPASAGAVASIITAAASLAARIIESPFAFAKILHRRGLACKRRIFQAGENTNNDLKGETCGLHSLARF